MLAERPGGLCADLFLVHSRLRGTATVGFTLGPRAVGADIRTSA
jgi:hypothetical protein